MKHCMMFCENQIGLNAVSRAMEQEGWLLDPAYDSKPLRLDAAIVFPLVKYESEEEKPKLEEEKKVGEFDDVVSIVSVDIALADELLGKGYTLLDHFAKTVTLIKRKPKAEEPKQDVGLYSAYKEEEDMDRKPVGVA